MATEMCNSQVLTILKGNFRIVTCLIEAKATRTPMPGVRTIFIAPCRRNTSLPLLLFCGVPRLFKSHRRITPIPRC